MNVTIDDTGGDSLTGAKPLYTESGNAYNWRGRPSQDPCPSCVANLDTTQTHLGTWHDGTCDEGGISTVSFSFSGSAVYVYAVLPNAVPGNSATHLAFHIDRSLVGTFIRQPNTSSSAPAYVYNQLVYANVSLGGGVDSGVERNFLIVNGGGADASLFLFDYAMYTGRSVGSTAGSTTASNIPETFAFHSAERSPVASVSSSSNILNMNITPSTSTSNRAQSSSVILATATATNIPTDAPDTPLAETSESSDRTGDHSSRTTSIVIATTTTTVTIIVIVLVLVIVRRRRRRRRSRMAAKVAALEKRMTQVHEAVGILGSYAEGGNRESGLSPNVSR
ncbi:hypothetical protein EXIGLDRAFT_838695, partial [Exidia glandulosa HHB12029]